MGRKSREKKERREHLSYISGMPNPIVIHMPETQLPTKVYRFFKKKDEAEALCKGDVWLSTLEICRGYEDPLRGDPDEATQLYNSGHLSGGSSDLHFVDAAANAGVFIGPGCSNITINNAIVKTRMPNAFVLCTTREFQPENLNDSFGHYCVEISNLVEFFKVVTVNLHKLSPVNQCAMGNIRYGSNSFSGYEQPPGPIGFVKNRDKYAPQKEFRFLWESKDSAITPRLISCPELANHCRMMTS